MEKRRTPQTFLLATGLGALVTVGLLWLGDLLLQAAWPGNDPLSDPLPYLIVAAEGTLVGVLLGRLVGYYPSLEGFLASLLVPIWVVTRAGFALDLDSFVTMLLRFEAHFAALYLSAFLLFMIRGGGMFYPRFIGLRYLRFKMITGITVIGVAFGVAGLMVVLSVMSGFENDLKDKIVGTNAHAILQKRGLDFVEHEQVLTKVRALPGVVAASPFIYNEVMVSSEYNISGVFIRGIDVDTAASVTELTIEDGGMELLVDPGKVDAYLDAQFRKSLPPLPAGEDRPAAMPGEGAEPDRALVPTALDPRTKDDGGPMNSARDGDVPMPDPLVDGDVPMPEPLFAGKMRKRQSPGILIGKELQKILKVRVGDHINVVSPLSEELGPTGPVPKARSFRVAGVFYTGMYEYDAKSVYVTLKAAQDFFGLGQAVTGIALKFDKMDRAGIICERILNSLDGYPYHTRTWYDMNRSLFSALKMEKVGMFIVLIIVILVSSFGIISTLIMLVWEKVKEIAILKSMGATGDGVMKIFMVEGITIGLVGTVLGVLLGWGVCVLLMSYQFQLDPEVYYIEALPVNMDPVEFALIAGIALHISFIATIYPSRRASRLRPVEGLRYD